MGKTYCRPLKRGASWRSQNFGDTATVYGPHSGNDEACPSGTPVYAAGDGVVEWAGVFDNTYHDNLLWLLDMGGNVLVINCGDDEPTFIYGHLSRFHVQPGDRVRKGQHVADSGNSGYATTGAHLHVECVPPGYILNGPLLGRVDPDIYLTEWPEDIRFKPAKIESLQKAKENNMRIIARKTGTDEVYIGDFVTRRHVGSVPELEDLQWAAQHNFGPEIFDNGRIQDVERIEFIGKLI